MAERKPLRQALLDLWRKIPLPPHQVGPVSQEPMDLLQEGMALLAKRRRTE